MARKVGRAFFTNFYKINQVQQMLKMIQQCLINPYLLPNFIPKQMTYRFVDWFSYTNDDCSANFTNINMFHIYSLILSKNCKYSNVLVLNFYQFITIRYV